MTTDERFKFAVKSVVLIGGIAIAIFGAMKLRHKVLRTRRRYLDDLTTEFNDTRKDVTPYFNEMLAHTFISILPYILYRRKGNLRYARKFQELVEAIPDIAAVVSAAELSERNKESG